MQPARRVFGFILLLAVIIYFSDCQVLAQQITIDGFIKTRDELKDAMFDYSSISVHLINNKGYVKEKVKASPQGFWLLPIYDDDKSVYTLKAVSSNKALSIEPESIQVDMKALSKDSEMKTHDFYIVGYRVSSNAIKVQQLDSDNLLDGPAGVQVTIKGLGEGEKKLITKQDGSLNFDALPGNYEISASHSEWRFLSSSTTIKVNRDGTTSVDKPIIISGFSVKGKVVLSSSIEGSDSDMPIAGVEIYLKKPSTLDKSSIEKIKCTAPKDASKGICVTTSDSTGSYSFRGLPVNMNGDYTVSAEFKKFNIDPSEITFKISSANNVVLKKMFRVTGFSVKGSVTSATGKPLQGAKVTILNKKNNKKKEKITDSNGEYTLDDLNGSETFELQVEYKDSTFAKVNVSPLPSKTQIDPIKPTHVKVCGNLITESNTKERRTVILKVGDIKLQLSTSDKFCFDVPVQQKVVGASLEVLLENDQQFKYLPQQFDFNNEPTTTLQIAQKFSALTVSIKATSQARVDLFDKDKKKIASKTISPDEKVTFDNLLPTQYIATVELQTVCWKSSDIKVDLREKDQEITFEQVGYSIIIRSSHDEIKLSSKLKSSNEEPKISILNKGMNSLCVPSQGIYELKIVDSCFKFEDGNEFDYDTLSPKIVELDVSGFLIQGQIKTPNSNEYIVVHITNLDNESVGSQSLTLQNQGKISVVPATKQDDHIVFKYFTSSASETTLEIKPQSDSLLFFPQKRVVEITREMIHSGKCIPDVLPFEGKEGTYIQGSVGDKIKGVKISVNSGERETFTDKNGQFKIGPLYDDKQYELRAELEGYSFDYIGSNNFRANKLASITVVTNLEGVLISIVSSKFRSNSVVPSEGKITFYNLPNDKYFIKATLKEYDFEPSSKFLELSQGKDEEVSFQSKKIGFSAFGVVKSIGKEPEANIVIQAIAKDAGEYEEVTTDQNGSFRLRGLKPNVRYYITIAGNQNNIERFSPKQIVIQKEDNNDVMDNDFIIFKQSVLQFSGDVNVSHEADSTVEVDLMTSTNGKQFKVVESQKLPLTNFFQFTIPCENYLKDENIKFFVRITSTNKQGKLNSVTHSITSIRTILDNSAKEENKFSSSGVATLGSDIQTETLSATKYHVVVNFSIRPTEQSSSQQTKQERIDQKPLFALVFILLLIAAYRYRTNLEKFLEKKSK